MVSEEVGEESQKRFHPPKPLSRSLSSLRASINYVTLMCLYVCVRERERERKREKEKMLQHEIEDAAVSEFYRILSKE